MWNKLKSVFKKETKEVQDTQKLEEESKVSEQLEDFIEIQEVEERVDDEAVDMEVTETSMEVTEVSLEEEIEQKFTELPAENIIEENMDENMHGNIIEENIIEEISIEDDTTTKAAELDEVTKPKKEKKGLFQKLVAGLSKTRNSIIQSIDNIFSGFSSIDDEFYEELEEILIMADLGVAATSNIIEQLQVKVKEQRIKNPSECRQLLIDTIKDQMKVDQEVAYEFENQKSVVLVIGVNGVGKTTSIGKLAGQMKKKGKKVMVAAADTFRAAAIEQLTEWANRAKVDIISQQEGSDPAAVVFDAITAAKSRKVDVLFCDTAGRLHNKKNLMEELRKINRVIDREYPDAYRETLVVLDGTTGQNALVQAKQFNEIAEISGIVLTKLDGTAKGGIAIAIQAELGIPVKYIGIGEKLEDLQKFDADEFVNALFTVNGDANES